MWDYCYSQANKHTHHFTLLWFFLVMRTQDLLLANFKYTISIVKIVICCNYIPRSYSPYNWNFAPFGLPYVRNFYSDFIAHFLHTLVISVCMILGFFLCCVGLADEGANSIWKPGSLDKCVSLPPVSQAYWVILFSLIR